MLVLSRERKQVIRIGDDITVTVVDIRGDKIRLGIVAPKDVPVQREEVYRRMKENERRQEGQDVAQDGLKQTGFPTDFGT